MARKIRLIFLLFGLIVVLGMPVLRHAVHAIPAGSDGDNIQSDPGYVTLMGTVYYYDRYGQALPASNILALLIEVDDGESSADDTLQATITDSNGNFFSGNSILMLTDLQEIEGWIYM